MTGQSKQRFAGGLARTFVVAVATLAILLVCFSMYQYSQSPPTAPMNPRTGRLPIPGESPVIKPATGEPSGVMVDGTIVGASKDVWISLYTKDGRDSKLEMTVSDWAPKEGSDHEYLLRDPEIRMRTPEGNDLRVKASKGTLDAKRKSGSGLEPRRGHLSGNVVIEFDRRSEEDKAKMTEAERNEVRDHDLVRVTAPELLFDVEFGRLIMPGRIVLAARDANLEAHDVELQLDPQDNRVQSLRIDRGGRIELHSQSEGLGVSLGRPNSAPTTQSVADWLRESLRARMASQATGGASGAPAPKDVAPDPVPEAEADLPVFRTSKSRRPRTVSHYLGRFEGDVDARQQIGDVVQGRLQADWLEIVRELTLDKATEKKNANGTPTGVAPTQAAAPVPSERIVLSWSGRLVVTEHDLRPDESATASRLTAGGRPARLSHPEIEAVCTRMTYFPQSGDVSLEGEGSDTVLVRSLQQGIIAGQAVSVRRIDDALDILIDGPGRVWEDSPERAGAELGRELAASLGPANIEFSDKLRAAGRILQKTTLELTGAMMTREHRLIDRVTFTGPTTLRDKETSLRADDLDVAFATQESWRGVAQHMNKLTGTGNVVLQQERDRLTCDRIDVAMGAGPGGASVIRQATATGSVVALQGERTLKAREKLVVDFRSEDRADVVRVSDTISSADAPQGQSIAPDVLSLGGKTVAQRLRAFGKVNVIDPAQSLDLSCEELDCTLGGNNEIETATLFGLEDRPSSVVLETFSVTGRDIQLDVVNEWADVPGPGRMTILSQKDLDGRKVANPIPIAVTWTDGMKYRGRENRAVFSGRIHASSETSTTFDCEDSLLVEFEDAPAKPVRKAPGFWETWGISGAVNQVVTGRKSSAPSPLQSFAKEPRYIEASGKAVAQTAEYFEGADSLKSRARISGPKLSLHLRSELSKMLIEGPGDLLLEDFQPAQGGVVTRDAPRADLFSDQSDEGPSKTLIKWRQRMSYDFGIDQTQFEGDVQLTHLSGIELDKVFGVPEGGTSSTKRGRRTFLTSDTLTVDFTDSASRTKGGAEQRMGRISSDRLHQFRANGKVVLREEVEQFSLNADEITYERPRKILLIHGTPREKAQLVRQRPGRLPDQMAAERIFFNLETGKIEISRPTLKTGQ